MGAAVYLVGLSCILIIMCVLEWKYEKKLSFKKRASSKSIYESRWIIPKIESIFNCASSFMRSGELIFALFGVHIASIGVSALIGARESTSLIISIIAPLALIIFLYNRAARRQSALDQQIEAVLISLGNSLHLNPTVATALRSAERVIGQPMKNELRLVISEIDRGIDITHAFENFATRVGNEEAHLAAQGVHICRETGGNLARLMDGLAGISRTRTNLKGKIKAATSQQYITAVFVTVIPVVFMVLSIALNPDIKTSFKTHLGAAVMTYSFISVAIGFMLLKKMTRIFKEVGDR